jgi:transcriptional regulator with XRE-family HTH domain
MAKTLRSSEQLVFLELLRAARKGAGLTQQALAEKLRRPQSFVAKYENGERRIDVVEFVALARALDVSPVALLRRYVAATGSEKDARANLASHRRRAAEKLER